LGRDDENNPVVKHLNPYVKYGTDYYVCNVLNDNGNAAYARGSECRQYVYDGSGSTDYKVYYANICWAIPEGAVVAPSQQESNSLWLAHWNDPNSHGTSSTGSFKEYIYQIVKPVYSDTCSVCGEKVAN
jgi:hypothetical protein